jgi:pyruvate dehydrogenase E1 component alpha subunit
MDLENGQVVQLYEKMLLIRRFEEQSGRLYMQNKIHGFLHLYIGEEAIAVGAISSLRDDDYVITHYRDHGHALARGLHPNNIMAELMGKATGTSGGKGGSMHLFDVSKGFMGGHAIVGGQMPLASGLALAIKYRGEDRAVLCVFGDGAVNEGSFHETLNLASIWKLPVIFLLENNLYGMGTHIEKTRAGGKDIYLAADAYKIPAAQIDGMDVVAVRDSVTEALQRVRAGEGPVFLEAMTYRFVGHSLQDPQAYRDSDEIDEWRIRDPINTFREAALLEGLIDDGQITRVGERVDAAIAEAIAFAEQSDEPGPEALYENVYGTATERADE